MMVCDLEGHPAVVFGQQAPYGHVESTSSEAMGTGAFGFNFKTMERGKQTSSGNVKTTSSEGTSAQMSASNSHHRVQTTVKDDSDTDSNEEHSNSGDQDSHDQPSAAFSFQMDAAPKFRPHLKPKSRRTGYLMRNALDTQTSGFSSCSTLENASPEMKRNFAAMFGSSIYQETHEMSVMEEDDSVPTTSEDAQDSRVYSKGSPIGPASSMPLSSTKAVDMEELLEAASKLNLTVSKTESLRAAGKSNLTVPKTATAEKPPQYRRRPVTTQSVFMRPSNTTRQARIASAQAQVSSTPLRLESSFPDEDNIFYQPSMTLQFAAQRLMKNFRAANAFVAHYCDDQVSHPATFKPLVITQMESVVRDIRWASQFLRLGKLDWELVTMPHLFFDDVKALLPSLKKHLEKLCVKKCLRFLVDGLVELDGFEKAVWKLQGRRRVLENEARFKREAERAEEAVEATNSKHVTQGKVAVEEKATVEKKDLMTKLLNRSNSADRMDAEEVVVVPPASTEDMGKDPESSETMETVKEDTPPNSTDTKAQVEAPPQASNWMAWACKTFAGRNPFAETTSATDTTPTVTSPSSARTVTRRHTTAPPRPVLAYTDSGRVLKTPQKTLPAKISDKQRFDDKLTQSRVQIRAKRVAARMRRLEDTHTPSDPASVGGCG